MWKLFQALFEFLTSANKVADKAMGSEKVNDGRFEISKPTLTEAQVKKIADKRNRLADEMFGDLRRHPELSIIDKVSFEAKELSVDEQILLIRILEDRLNADETYNRIKNKHSKFKL
jgi:hypothetical protein